MASNSGRKSGSSGRSTSRKRVVIGASETTRVRYNKGQPEVKTERKAASQRSKKQAADGPSKQARAFARTKKEERERRQKQAKFKVGALWVGGLALVLGLVFGGIAMYNSQAFAISRVDVRGLSHVSKAEIVGRAAIPQGSTLLRVDTNAIESALLQSPWVASASVKREFPDVLAIEITERTPGARVIVGKNAWLVASDGTWMAPMRKGETPPAGVMLVKDVPALTPQVGVKTDSDILMNALAVIGGISKTLRPQISYVSAADIDKTSLFTKKGIEIIVGRAEEMERKSAIVLRILEEQKGNVVYINVRTTDRPTWRGLEN